MPRLGNAGCDPAIAIKDTVVVDQYFGLMMAQGRNIDQILPYLLLQSKVERG